MNRGYEDEVNFRKEQERRRKMEKRLAIDIGGSKVLVGGARQKHRVRS